MVFNHLGPSRPLLEMAYLVPPLQVLVFNSVFLHTSLLRCCTSKPFVHYNLCEQLKTKYSVLDLAAGMIIKENSETHHNGILWNIFETFDRARKEFVNIPPDAWSSCPWLQMQVLLCDTWNTKKGLGFVWIHRVGYPIDMCVSEVLQNTTHNFLISSFDTCAMARATKSDDTLHMVIFLQLPLHGIALLYLLLYVCNGQSVSCKLEMMIDHWIHKWELLPW